MTGSAMVLLVFGPLLAACAVVLLPADWRFVPVAATLVALPLLLLPVTAEIARQGVVELALAGHAPPLGIRLRADALSLLMLWLVAAAGGLAAAHALAGHRPSAADGARFWPLWLFMITGLNALFLAADLFNLYVSIELMTLAAIALIATGGQPDALRAAMRYLLLAMFASLAYLLGVALLYAAHGTLDLYGVASGMAGAGAATLTALALMTAALLLKGAIFPLHLWLPAAHANAPGPVSAMLSALVVKTSVYLLFRLWFWSAAGLDREAASLLLGLLGAAAVLFGSVAALVQDQIKRIVAYSTVAQLGYLMLVFPLIAHHSAWSAAGYQLLSHGLAKAGMFLAAANIVQAMGSGRLDRLAGSDRVVPVSLFAFALAGVSLMGLPPSGGFLAKWLLLEAAWALGGWGWMAVILMGSLLAAGYLFRVLAAVLRQPGSNELLLPVQAVPRPMEMAALLLGAAAVMMGFVAVPVLELLSTATPPVVKQ
jgi:formate hydrogenlyase subunit 3/multisubunit Na+/H+ antiporter MnhD subunit